MNPEQISSNCYLFPFKDPFLTNVLVIKGIERIYVLDTFLGIDSMEIVKDVITNELGSSMPIVVFNSHGDYDHYWGNGAFGDTLIVGYDLCRKRILTESQEALEKHKGEKQGEVLVKAPNLTFSDKIKFPTDGLTFFHTPGHTRDSASCYFEKEKILFVGDNVETPLPYTFSTDLFQFGKTLKSYLEIDWDVMIASHAPALYDKALLQRNIEYIESLVDWSIELSTLNKDELHFHLHNMNFLKENMNIDKVSPEAKRHFEEVSKLKRE
jgi:glyoxylase-like metal-dependent hydrolase (beta-lactamase superfamily II)